MQPVMFTDVHEEAEKQLLMRSNYWHIVLKQTGQNALDSFVTIADGDFELQQIHDETQDVRQ